MLTRSYSRSLIPNHSFQKLFSNWIYRMLCQSSVHSAPSVPDENLISQWQVFTQPPCVHSAFFYYYYCLPICRKKKWTAPIVIIMYYNRCQPPPKLKLLPVTCYRTCKVYVFSQYKVTSDTLRKPKRSGNSMRTGVTL